MRVVVGSTGLVVGAMDDEVVSAGLEVVVVSATDVEVESMEVANKLARYAEKYGMCLPVVVAVVIDPRESVYVMVYVCAVLKGIPTEKTSWLVILVVPKLYESPVLTAVEKDVTSWPSPATTAVKARDKK